LHNGGIRKEKHMSEMPDWEKEAEKLIDETLSSLETTADHLEALARMSQDLDQPLSDMRSWIDRVENFLSSNFRIALVSATIIIGASLAGYVRGWWQARRIGL
jgi:hypothetical protein